MTLSAIGFDGTVDEVQDAKRSRFLGTRVAVVDSYGDFAVTVNTGADRTVNIATGVAAAHGIVATSDAVATMAFDTVATVGASRWDAVCLHRDWSTNAVTIIKVNGTSAAGAPQVIPPGLVDNPGVAHDQLLALVQITNGNLQPTAIVSYRMYGSKVITVPSVAALPTATLGLYGLEAVVPSSGGDARYRCVVDGANNPAWIPAGGGAGSALLSATALLNCNGTLTDVPGLTFSVTSSGVSDVIMVTAAFDIQVVGTTGFGSAIGALVVDGVSRPEQAVFTAAPGTSDRSTSFQQWRLTNLSAGAHTIKAQARNSGSLAYRVYNLHSTLAYMKI